MRWALWWNSVADEEGNVKSIDDLLSSPDDVTDETVYEHYDGIYFVEEDFFCSKEE